MTMLSSLNIGMSGLVAYSQGLKQISNNISNLNSSGYKGTDLSFSNLYSGSSGASGGAGVELTESRLDLSSGELRQSDRDLDISIDGEGFLVLKSGDEYLYVRTGQFEVNEKGDIVLQGTDYTLTGLNESGIPEALSLDGRRVSNPKPTTVLKLTDNLSSSGTSHTIGGISVYNSLGDVDEWSAEFSRPEVPEAGKEGEWTLIVTDSSGQEIDTRTVVFENGSITEGSQKFTISDNDSGRNVEFDLSEGVSSFSAGEISSLRVEEIDGQGLGEITSIAVNDDGEMEISYSNEDKISLGSVTIAKFDFTEHLRQRSDGMFTSESTSGRIFLTSQSGLVGEVLSQRVEASNIDLSSEFGDLIVIQRGYQASSQVVSVSNEMIQELFSIKGRG